MKITYTFVDGTTATIEVDENWGKILLQLEKDDFNSQNKESRRHVSLETMVYEGVFFATNDSFFETLFDGPDEVEILYKAMEKLSQSQKELLKALYFEGLTQEEYAERKGVHRTAINKQHTRILKKIKKFFEKPSLFSILVY